MLGTGTVTTEAMRFCDDKHLPLIVARPGGAEPFMVGTPALYDHGGLRHAQALAAYTPLAMDVTRWLLDRRLADQARIASKLLYREDVAALAKDRRSALVDCESASEALLVESAAAVAYWSAWSDVEVRFAPKDHHVFPSTGFASAAGVARCARKARRRPTATPGDVVNGLANFGYWLCQSEAPIALLSMGLDPSLGFFHACDQNRPAAVLDLMEAGRGVVEEAVLRLVAERVWRKASFVESRSGELRLAAPVAHELAGVLSPVLRESLGPVAEELGARLFLSSRARLGSACPHRSRGPGMAAEAALVDPSRTSHRAAGDAAGFCRR